MAFNQNLSSGLVKFTFTDEDGDVFAYFRMNPTDVRLVERAEGLQRFFEAVGKKTDNLTIQDVISLNSEIEDKICAFLGYDARSELFGMMSATTILPDGNIFAMVVFEAITKAINPEIEKRAQKMRDAVSKYTAKYDRV